MMQRNTMTILGQLRIGDRFCYPGKRDVWQVVNFLGKNKVAVNQFHMDGTRYHYYDVIKPAATSVKFLRHTVLEFADECLVEMLRPGDVFTRIDNIVLEYQVREQFNDNSGKECKAFKLDGTNDIVFIPHGTEVIFIRKSKSK